MNRTSSFLFYFASIVFAVLLAYGGFKLYRWFNWTFGYEDFVKQTIHNTVKPECLK